MLNRLRARIGTVFVLTALAAFMALPAFAQEAGTTAVNTAVGDAASSASSLVTTNIPIILGVALLWVALKFGKKLLAKI
jgi:hypothetical protein